VAEPPNSLIERRLLTKLLLRVRNVGTGAEAMESAAIQVNLVRLGGVDSEQTLDRYTSRRGHHGVGFWSFASAPAAKNIQLRRKGVKTHQQHQR